MFKHIFDKIKTYPIVTLLTGWAMFIGVNFFIPGSRLETSVFGTYEDVQGLVFVSASLLIFMGVFWQGKNLDTEWLFIRMGLVILVYAWLSYGILIGWSGYILSIINLVLFIQFLLRERVIRRNIGK